MAIATNQEHFRIRTDATAAQGGTPVWAAAVDTNPTSWSAVSLTPFRIRFSIANTGTTTTASSVWNIFVCRNGTGTNNATGTYTQVTTASSFVQSTDATAGASADNSAISTELLGVVGSNTFANGQYDSSDATAAQALAATHYTEFEFGLKFLNTVLPGDTYAFRVYIAGVALGTYTAALTPAITITSVPITVGLAPASSLGANVTQDYNVSVVNLVNTQPSQDENTPVFTDIYIADVLRNSSPVEESLPIFSLASNTWQGAAGLNPLTAWTVTEYQLQVAAVSASIAATLASSAKLFEVAALHASVSVALGAAASTFIFDSEAYAVATALIANEHQFDVAAINAAAVSALAVSEHQLDAARWNASVAAALGANAATFIFDLSETLIPSAAIASSARLFEVAAASAAVISNWLVTESQRQIAAYSASVVSALGASALTFIFDTETFVPVTNWTTKEHIYEVAKLNAAVAANLAVTEKQYQVAALSATVAASLGVNALTYIFDTEILSPLTAFTVSEYQYQVAALNASILSTLGADVTFAGAGISISSMLAPVTSWTTREFQYQIAAINASISSTLAVAEKQRQVASFNATIVSGLGSNVLTYIFDTEALSPSIIFKVSEHQYQVAAFNASIVPTLYADLEFAGAGISISSLLAPVTTWTVREFQYQVAAVNAAVSTTFLVTERQRDIASAAFSASAASSGAAAQLDVSTAALSPAAGFGASVLTYIFDTAETLSALTTATFGANLFEVAKSALVPALALGANAQTYILDLAEHLSPLSSLGANAKTFIFDTEAFAVSCSIGANASYIYGFTAVEIDSGAAVLGQPGISVAGEMLGNNIATVADGIGEPSLTTVYSFAATNLATSAVALGAPSFNESDILSAVNIATAADGIGVAACAVKYNPTAPTLACGAAEIDEPSLSIVYAFAASNLTSAAVAIGQASFNESDILSAVNLTAASDNVGAAALTTKYTFAASFATGAAKLGAPIYSKIGSISAASLSTGACNLGQPHLGFSFPLVAKALSTGNINIGPNPPVFFAENRNTLYNTMRRLQGVSRAAETRHPPTVKPPFTTAQIRKMKAFSENYMRRFDRE